MSDQTKNFAYSTTSAAVTSVATSFSVQSGHGSRFPATSGGAYNLVVWDSRYPSAAVAYQNSAAEIIRVTTRSTDTFSVITRAQEGTSAIAWGADWRVEMNITAKNFEEASSSVSGLVSTGTQTFSGVKTFNSNIAVGASTATDGAVKFYNSGDSNYIEIVSPVAPSTDYTITLPTATGTMALRSQIKSILSWCQAGNFNSNSTGYITPGLAAVTQSADNYKISLPACTIGELRVFSSANTLNGNCVFTVLKNGSVTAVTCTVGTGSTTASDTSNTVAFSADDELSIKVASAGNSGTINNLGITVVANTFS